MTAQTYHTCRADELDMPQVLAAFGQKGYAAHYFATGAEAVAYLDAAIFTGMKRCISCSA